jgi:Domain of unknown function (DUF4326)
MIIRVVNVRGMNKPEERENIVYVGRAFAGWPANPLGNPFKLEGDIDSCLEKYRRWVYNSPDFDMLLFRLWKLTNEGTKPLGCWCSDWDGVSKPKPKCHAVVLAEILCEFVENGGEL